MEGLHIETPQPTALVSEDAVEAVPNTAPTDQSDFLIAAQRGDFDTFSALIEDGHDINELAPDGTHALHWAAGNNHWRIVEKLLALKVDPNVAGGPCNARPLHWACRSGRVYIAQLLIHAGADINAVDTDGYTPLHVAVHSSNVLLVIYLLHLRAHVDVEDNHKRTPLLWAAYQGDHLSVRSLLRAGADPNLRDSDGFIPLHWALVCKSLASLKLLVAAGSDLSIKTNDNKGPWIIAEEMNSVNEWTVALWESGFLPQTGVPRRKIMGPLTTKFICFIYPFLVLTFALHIISWNPIIGILATGALVYFFHKVFQIYVYYNLWPGHKGMIKSPIMAGIYCSFYIWICLVASTVIIPAMYATRPYMCITFIVLASIVLVSYLATVFLDPGYIRPGSLSHGLEQLEDLLNAGELTAKTFCVETWVRKPARSKYSRINDAVIARFDHYCPWTFNSIGLRNHRAFMVYLTTLSAALVVIGVLYVSYLHTLDPNLWHAIKKSPFLFVLCIGSIFQALWIWLLTGVQYLQILKGITSAEIMDPVIGESFSSLPPDHPKALGLKPLALPDPSLVPRKSFISGTCLKTLGVEQAVMTSRALRRHKKTNTNYGAIKNCGDFWCGGGFFLLPSSGQGRLNGTKVDYYTLWSIPGQGQNYASQSEAENVLRQV